MATKHANRCSQPRPLTRLTAKPKMAFTSDHAPVASYNLARLRRCSVFEAHDRSGRSREEPTRHRDLGLVAADVWIRGF
jgi:hypothetical protein